MPLGGLRCCRDNKIAAISDCKDRAKCGECDYPLPLFHYLEHKQGSRANAGLSVTTVLNCARKAELEKEFPFYVTPATMGARFQGDMWHTAMEQWIDDPDAIVERRYGITIDGVEITGQSDLVIRSTGLAADHKTTSKPLWCEPGDTYCESRRIKDLPDYYINQLGFYRLLIEDGYFLDTREPTGVTIKKMVVWYFNPTNGSRVFDVPLLDKEYSYDLLRQHLAPIVAARERGERPGVLTPQIITGRATKRKRVQRDFRCTNCELRTVCDQLATLDRGVSPDDPAYWEEPDGISE